jgi:hypothetical protein
MYFSLLRFFHVWFGLVIIVAIAVCKFTFFIRLIFWEVSFQFFSFFSLYCFNVEMQCCSNRSSTHFCLLLTFKQFVMLPLSPLFCVMFSTLVKQIPDPVQNMALSFGWSSFGDTVPIVLAWLNATYSIPGFCSLVVKSPGSTIKCLNWSFFVKTILEALNLMDGCCPGRNKRTVCHLTA